MWKRMVCDLKLIKLLIIKYCWDKKVGMLWKAIQQKQECRKITISGPKTKKPHNAIFYPVGCLYMIKSNLLNDSCLITVPYTFLTSFVDLCPASEV